MGGLRQRMPLAFWSFVAGSAALAALPLTAGYSSKHAILAAVAVAPGGLWLWGAGIVGAVLTALYSFRLVFAAFFGPENHKASEHLGVVMAAPLMVLTGLALGGAWLPWPTSGGLSNAALTQPDAWLGLAADLAPWVGLALAAQFYLFRSWPLEPIVDSQWGEAVQRWWLAGWGFDWLYGLLLAQPVRGLAEANRDDVLDDAPRALAYASRQGHRALAYTQNGRLRWYAAGLASGVLLALALGVLS